MNVVLYRMNEWKYNYGTNFEEKLYYLSNQSEQVSSEYITYNM